MEATKRTNMAGHAAPAKQNNAPVKKFRAGAISATIWENQGTNNQGQPTSFRNVSFERAYKDANGAWQNTHQLRLNDIPKAMLVLSKAYEYLAMNSENDE